MYTARKKSTANLKLTDNLIVSPDTSTLYSELCWMTWLQNREASGLMQRLIVCVPSATEWLVSNVATRILIGTYKFRTTNKTLLPLRIFVSWNPWHLFVEPSWRNSGLSEVKPADLEENSEWLVTRPIFETWTLTLRLLMSYIYGAPSKVRNANVVYIWTYVWQR